MFKFFNLFQRNSLITTLLLVVGLLSGLAIAAAVSGWQLLDRVSQTQNYLSNNSIPLVTAAQDLATESAAIALLAPQIRQIDDGELLEEFSREILIHLDLMKNIPGQIKVLSSNKYSANALDKVVSQIDNEFVRIRAALKTRLESDARRADANNRIGNKIDSIQENIENSIKLQSEVFFDESSDILSSQNGSIKPEHINKLLRMNLDNEALFGLGRHADDLNNLVSSIRSITSLEELKEVKSRIDFRMRLMVSDSITLDSDNLALPLGHTLDEMYKLFSGKNNPISLQQEYIAILLELEEVNSGLQNSVYELNALTKGLVIQVKDETQLRSKNAHESAQFGTNILLIIVIFSVIVSIVAIWSFAIQKIGIPLRDLADTMRQVSNRSQDAEVKSYVLLELNEIALGIEAFRNNNIALDMHQKSLQENNALLSKVNDDLNTFVHVASHDLQTPLRGIQLLSDFIENDIKTDNFEAAFENLSHLKKRIVRLSELLESLLKYTKADASVGVAKAIDVRRLIDNTFDLMGVDEKFKLILPDDLPVCQIIESDLTVIFLNIFDNAINHHDRNEGLITVNYSENEECYIFEISDDGPGIDPQFHHLIFEILKTLKPKDVVEGSGVGLAHVKRLIESRGGKIAVFSDPEVGRGSRFVLHYPKLGLAV